MNIYKFMKNEMRRKKLVSQVDETLTYTKKRPYREECNYRSGHDLCPVYSIRHVIHD